MSVLDSILSVMSGGFTGLIGTAVQGYYTYKSKQLDIDLEKSKAANEIALRNIDVQIQATEWASRTQIAQITTDGEVDKTDAVSLAASYTQEPTQYSEKTLLGHSQEWVMVFLDAFKAVIRPGLTVYLCAITTMVYIQTRGLIKVDVGDSFVLLQKLVDTILYLTTTCVLWWFGSRNKVKK